MTLPTKLPLSLPRSLSFLETWGFGLTGLLLWLGIAPAMQLELSWQALWVWFPGTVVGILINLQVQRLGQEWVDLSGGTPSYLSRLLPDTRWLATYGALGYYLSWVAVLPVSAIVLADLVQANLSPFGLDCPVQLLQVGFTILTFVVAYSGTRALGILHLFFVVPAVSLLLLFCIQGIGWLIITDNLAGPTDWGEFHLGAWTKWYVVATYAVYACESGAAFVADSRDPHRTLKVLPIAAGLIPLVYLAGSWILLQLNAGLEGANTPYQQLIAASPFWGPGTSFLVTFLLVSGSLLSCATAVSSAPRMLYQLALDGQLPPIFTQLSRQGTLGVGLLLTLLLSVAFLLWGDIAQIVLVTGLGWLSAFAIFHWGLWRQRRQPYVRWPRWSLWFAVLEAVIVVFGGWAWAGQDLLLGLLLPIAVWMLLQGVGRLPWPGPSPEANFGAVVGAASLARDWAIVQIAGLIGLLSIAISASWFIHGWISALPGTNQANLLVVVLLVGVALGVAIAGWTTFPQVTALGKAREQAEQFFNLAADGVLVVDNTGLIRQANRASQALFDLPAVQLIGQPLSTLLPDLPTLNFSAVVGPDYSLKTSLAARTVEIRFSQPGAVTLPEPDAYYVAIVRDITQQQSSEDALRQKADELQQLLSQLTRAQSQLIQSEKMSSLGQLMAGVAHEINNPLTFITGNISFAQEYAIKLLQIVDAYQQTYPHPSPALARQIEAIELDFLKDDFLKLLESMEEGAKRIITIVQSLKGFSRHDESPVKVVNLHDGIDSTLLILKNRLKAQSSQAEIQIKRVFSALPPVECYPSALNQVFMNLLVNAIYALENSPSPGIPTITITTRSVTQDHRPGVSIAIADNGPGVSEEQLERLCDPFYTTKPIGEGTGLGLAISYQIVVERHGGSFGIESVPGAGMQFTLWLPLTLPEKAAAQPPSTPQALTGVAATEAGS